MSPYENGSAAKDTSMRKELGQFPEQKQKFIENVNESLLRHLSGADIKGYLAYFNSALDEELHYQDAADLVQFFLSKEHEYKFHEYSGFRNQYKEVISKIFNNHFEKIFGSEVVFINYLGLAPSLKKLNIKLDLSDNLLKQIEEYEASIDAERASRDSRGRLFLAMDLAAAKMARDGVEVTTDFFFHEIRQIMPEEAISKEEEINYLRLMFWYLLEIDKFRPNYEVMAESFTKYFLDVEYLSSVSVAERKKSVSWIYMMILPAFNFNHPEFKKFYTATLMLFNIALEHERTDENVEWLFFLHNCLGHLYPFFYQDLGKEFCNSVELPFAKYMEGYKFENIAIKDEFVEGADGVDVALVVHSLHNNAYSIFTMQLALQMQLAGRKVVVINCDIERAPTPAAFEADLANFLRAGGVLYSNVNHLRSKLNVEAGIGKVSGFSVSFLNKMNVLISFINKLAPKLVITTGMTPYSNIIVTSDAINAKKGVFLASDMYYDLNKDVKVFKAFKNGGKPVMVGDWQVDSIEFEEPLEWSLPKGYKDTLKSYIDKLIL